MKKTNLSLEPYKGTRDFYPEDEFVQEYIFRTMRSVVERYGYEPYNASILEEADLYRAKSGEEIANEQTYLFTDRGGREVALRPEMTPTVARMIAKRRQELGFPARWYSIPNVFRYERPQRGRLREHWQLNADIFGASGLEAEIELIEMASDLMKAFGAKEKDFEIRVNLNSRDFAKLIAHDLGFPEEESVKLMRLIDKRGKMPASEFQAGVKEMLGDKSRDLFAILDAPDPVDPGLITLLMTLRRRGIKNVRFYPSLVRGFQYYTGNVFEVFDTNKENPRSLFGGGRYDELLDIFGVEKVPAAGFGMGDVTIRDYLETHRLLPKYAPKTQLYICRMGETREFVEETARYFREKGLNVGVDLTDRKVSLQMKSASKLRIPFVMVIGEDEAKKGVLPLKNMATGKETKMKKEKIVEYIQKNTH
jgi:histidyl-tRNA synthetase